MLRKFTLEKQIKIRMWLRFIQKIKINCL